MSKNAHREFFAIGRRKLLSLCLLAALATPVCAEAEQYSGSSSATVNIDAVLVDPSGFEADGAGAVERATSFETADMAVLVIWAALVLSMAGIAFANQRRSKRAVNLPHLGQSDSAS
jgi:predicted membrane protein